MVVKGQSRPMEKEILLAGRWTIVKQLGKGAFGELFLCKDRQGKMEFAAKLERLKCPSPQLAKEAEIYRILNGNNINPPAGIAKIHFTGEQDDYRILIIDALGPSLEDNLKQCGGRFSLKTTMMIGLQMISLIEALHMKTFIHRDIKPDNFLFGVGSKNRQLYIIDFGLSHQYMKTVGDRKEHIPFRQNRSLTGTVRYASIPNHKGYEQGRRDDLESMNYVLLYLLRGKLPWQGIPVKVESQRFKAVLKMKEEMIIPEVYAEYPIELQESLRLCRSLSFDAKPSYDYLRNLFIKILKDKHYEIDYIYDWCVADKKIFNE